MIILFLYLLAGIASIVSLLIAAQMAKKVIDKMRDEKAPEPENSKENTP